MNRQYNIPEYLFLYTEQVLIQHFDGLFGDAMNLGSSVSYIYDISVTYVWIAHWQLFMDLWLMMEKSRQM